MVFSSAIFIFGYLPLVFLGYALLPKRFLILFFFLVNLVFYGWGEPAYLFLMVFSIALNYGAALLIVRIPRRKRPLLAFCVALNVLLLLWFKYAGLAAETLLRAAPGLFPALALFAPPRLPIGISFYTFQAMAYVIDVYRGDIKAERGFMKFGVFIALFPQLIAGPIARFSDVTKRLDAGMSRDVRVSEIDRGIKTFICGLSKKLLLANPMGQAWEAFSNAPGQNGVAGAWIGLVMYAFHIYFDFSGYSDMAVGLGRILGIRFPENFNYPYISKSVTDFWRRWHITLSSWFRDYVYIPLGGNRKGLARSVLNLFIVWFLTGLWHGAAWNFAVWGLYFAIILTAEKSFLLAAFDKIKLPAFFRHIYALALIVVGWRIFTFGDAAGASPYFMEMFGMRAQISAAGASAASAPSVLSGASGAIFAPIVFGGAFSHDSFRYTLAYLPMLFICAAASTPLPKRVWRACLAALGKRSAVTGEARVTGGPAADTGHTAAGNLSRADDNQSAAGNLAIIVETLAALAAFILCVAAVTAQSYNPFIYFRF